MKQVHQDIDVKNYSKGINSDANPEIVASQDGILLDSLNTRSMSMDGDNLSRKKIKGEELLYRGLDNKCFGGTGLPIATSYHCMSSFEINNFICEFWADQNGVLDPFFRVNGKIVMQSPDLPIYYDYPIQIDKNENCNTGEFYVTNNLTPPMVFSLKDIMLNGGVNFGSETAQCTTKYFDDFNISEYTVNVTSSLYQPAFIQSYTGTSGPTTFNQIFGSLGLPVGSYSYSYRYVTPDGDRSTWSPISPLIPVVSNIGTNSGQNTFPANRTYSKDPDISLPSAYGNHIRIRFDNGNGFESIEVRRDSWYAGDPIGNPPTSEIIGLVPINAGVGYLELLDRASGDEIEEVITIDEQVDQLTSIKRAKAIRYYNERLYLMNVEYNSKDIDAEIELIDDNQPGFPTIQKIGKKGHKDTYNSTYYKSDMRGEKISTAIVLYDESCNPTYAKKIEDNFQFPNRREECSAETQGNSYYGMVTAANINNGIGLTHEVFDHVDAIGKENGRAEMNILDRGGRTYFPMHPVSSIDTEGQDLSKQINDFVAAGGILDPKIPYNPKGFGLDYYAMGYSFKGIDTTNKPIPSWASGFSVVQTEPAKRVVAQGMGYYRLETPDGTLGPNGGKSTNEFYVYFPDLDDNIGINPGAFDDLISDFSAFQLQLVSPVGFFSEVYSFLNNFGSDDGVDMITYQRILFDDGNINPTSTTSNTGINGYTGFGKWRNPTNGSPFTANDGNMYFDIIGVEEVITHSSSQKYLKVVLNQSMYAEWGGNGETAEDKTEVKEWQEPMYVVNLVRRDAAVPDTNTTQYKYGGNFVKFDSVIYQVSANGEQNFTVPLVSERWEDCVPTLSGMTYNAYSSLYRFVYVKDTAGNTYRWLNVTNETAAFVNQVLTDIQNNGFATVTDSSGSYNVYGVYKHTQSSIGENVIVSLKFEWFNQSFDQSFMVPPASSRVSVKYDNRIPVRVFSGDTYVNESVWAVKDIRFDKNANSPGGADEFRLEMAFPYGEFWLPSGIQIIQNPNVSLNWIQDAVNCRLRRGTQGATIRQLLSVWTAESRTNLSFAFNDNSTLHSYDAYFPLKNYVQRPYQWQDDQFNNGAAAVYADNHIFSDYETDYGDEYLLWGLGGFRYRPQVNIDYSKSQNTTLLTSVPQVGFQEQNRFCTRIIWSERRPINAQNTPTVRTFPPTNFYDISDDTGEIKKAWSAISSDKGNNLYAFTNSGICLVLVDKRVIHEINANELATVGSDIGGVLNELWINRQIGMNDETWRSAAEYSNTLFFVNSISMYQFADNQLLDIGNTGYKDRLNLEFLPMIGQGYSNHLTGGFDPFHQEYLVGFRPSITSRVRPESTVIYGVQQAMVQCRSSYNYDQYLYVDNKVYGMKDGNTYLLGVGNQIDGVDIEASVAGLSNKDMFFDKEFIRIRVNSNFKPERIEFYDSVQDYYAGVPSSFVDAIVNPLSIKDYFGYECFIPRKTLAPHGRQQGRYVVFKVINSQDEDFLIVNTGVTYKPLK
jgi:hypothetical protein